MGFAYMQIIQVAAPFGILSCIYTHEPHYFSALLSNGHMLVRLWHIKPACPHLSSFLRYDIRKILRSYGILIRITPTRGMYICDTLSIACQCCSSFHIGPLSSCGSRPQPAGLRTEAQGAM